MGPGQYGSRPLPNQAAPHSQFPPYQQNWGPQAPQPPMNHIQGKGAPPPNATGSPRPINHLKQHLLHKGGYGGAQSPTPPQGPYVNGPGMLPPMGPPQMHQRMPAPTSMGPPTSAPPHNSHPDGPMPHEGPQDNGISSTGSTGPHQHPVTSIITTGPDGAPLDDASQQSTISNTSAASIDDPQCSTPKSRKNDSYSQSHLTTPPSAAATPHDDFEMGSPSPTWPRTPASPVFNSHTPAPEVATPQRSSKVRTRHISSSNQPAHTNEFQLQSNCLSINCFYFFSRNRTVFASCTKWTTIPIVVAGWTNCSHSWRNEGHQSRHARPYPSNRWIFSNCTC